MNSETYKEAQFLRFVTIAQLKEMGFQLGEIAAICDAVEWWSVLVFKFQNHSFMGLGLLLEQDC